MLNFFSITGIITGIFTTATLTSYTICKIYDYPFYNPKMNEHQFLKKINVIANLSFFILLESILLSKYIFYNFIEDMPHSYLKNIINISFYSMCIELLYYSYHRIIHHKYFYKYIHSKHHENIEVYPLDTFYFGYFDSNFLILSFGIPIMFMRLNFFEHIFTLYIYIIFLKCACFKTIIRKYGLIPFLHIIATSSGHFINGRSFISLIPFHITSTSSGHSLLICSGIYGTVFDQLYYYYYFFFI
jgi:sterol desaturase/sphingolipid hydroxylase (fatty acid hydroxylase superfamily)